MVHTCFIRQKWSAGKCLTDVCVSLSRFKNDNGIGITSLEWDPRGRGKGGDLLAFADNEGYVGVFEKVYPSSEGLGEVGGEGGGEVGSRAKDALEDDSLLMEVRSEYSVLNFEAIEFA